MSTPQTLPSKAVLRVLQGLLLGTSCSLAVLIEDRRRRINAVQAVIENGKRLRALPMYREGGTERAIARALAACNLDQDMAEALREGLVPDAALFQPRLSTEFATACDTKTTSSPSKSASGSRKDDEKQNEALPVYTLPIYRYARMSLPKYFAGMDRLADRHRRSPLSRAIRGDVARPSRNEAATIEMTKVIATVSDLLDSPNDLEWAKGWEIAFRALSQPTTRPLLETVLLENILHLARTLEDAGRVQIAAELLRLVTRSETSVSMGEPNFVESVLVDHIQSLFLNASDLSEDEKTREVDRAVHFYVAAFGRMPPSEASSIAALGTKVIPLVVELGMVDAATRLVTACPETHPRFWNLCGILVKALLARRAHLEAIDYFLSNYTDFPEGQQLPSIVDAVVDAVFELGGLRASSLLEFLLGVPWIRRIKPCWAARLLEGHWKHTRDFAETERLYKRVLQHSPPGKNTTARRTMMQIAFDAGEHEAGHRMSKDILSMADPSAGATIRVFGTLALAEARSGQWQTVHSIYQEMIDYVKREPQTPSGWEFIGRSFPRVVDEFGKSHTLGEIRSFVEHFVAEVGVPVDKYIATLLSKKYAQAGDPQAVISWLSFCATHGFANSPVFLSALLTSCRHWGYNFRSLKALANRMQKLLPSSRPDAYLNIIRDAASRTRSKRPSSLYLAVESIEMGNERAICRAMVAAIRRGVPQTALEIYHDMKSINEVDRTGSCLKAAIHASILTMDGESRGALALLREAQARGQNISASLTLILAAHLGQLSPLVDPVQEATRVVGRLKDQKGVTVPSGAFIVAASRFLRTRRFDEAVTFCRVAMEMDGSPDAPCNRDQFLILAEAYAMTKNAPALESLFMEHSHKHFVVSSPISLKVLRRVKHGLVLQKRSNARYDSRYDKVIESIAYAVRIVSQKRALVFRKDTTFVEDAAIKMVVAANPSSLLRRTGPANRQTSLDGNRSCESKTADHKMHSSSPAQQPLSVEALRMEEIVELRIPNVAWKTPAGRQHDAVERVVVQRGTETHQAGQSSI